MANVETRIKRLEQMLQPKSQYGCMVYFAHDGEAAEQKALVKYLAEHGCEPDHRICVTFASAPVRDADGRLLQ